MKTDLVDRVRTRLMVTEGEATPSRVAAALRDEGLVLGDSAVLDLVHRLRHEFIGAGPLESLLRDPLVTDVLVNGPDAVWVDRGMGLEREGLRFESEADVRRLAQRLAAAAGRRLDEASPHVDARLRSGVRLHAVIPPLSVDGTAISLRVPSSQPLSLSALVAREAVDGRTAALLRGIVHARLALLVTGGTGTGKTTVLSALLSEVAEQERIVIVEDSTELAPHHPHVVRLQSRLPNVEGAGEVTGRDLVRQALRMRPDRIVVGEVRGAEVVDMLAAMNTGHEGGAGTIHANSPEDLPARLEALGIMAGLTREAVHALLGSAIDVVIHLRFDGARRRVIDGLHVLRRGPDGFVETMPALIRTPTGLVRGDGFATLQARVDMTAPT